MPVAAEVERSEGVDDNDAPVAVDGYDGSPHVARLDVSVRANVTGRAAQGETVDRSERPGRRQTAQRRCRHAADRGRVVAADLSPAAAAGPAGAEHAVADPGKVLPNLLDRRRGHRP